MFAIVTLFAACWLAAVMLPTIVGKEASLWEIVSRVFVGPIIGEASIVISVVVVVTAHAAAGASITITSVEGGIGEGGVVLETATLAGLISSRYENLGSPHTPTRTVSKTSLEAIFPNLQLTIYPNKITLLLFQHTSPVECRSCLVHAQDNTSARYLDTLHTIVIKHICYDGSICDRLVIDLSPSSMVMLLSSFLLHLSPLICCTVTY